MKGLGLKNPPTAEDHYQGPLSAPITIVEYGDFECLACGGITSILEFLKAEFRNDLCFTYRHFPLTKIHPHAEIAALASEAAGRQGHFWNMHYLLFKNQDALSLENILILADSLNLDEKKFKDDLHSQDLLTKIHNDYNSGIVSGVSDTPTIFLDGIIFESPQNVLFFKSAIDQRLFKNSLPLNPELDL